MSDFNGLQGNLLVRKDLAGASGAKFKVELYRLFRPW